MPTENPEGSPSTRRCLEVCCSPPWACSCGADGDGNISAANAPILLFFGYCAISILWSDYSFVALKRWSKAIGDLAVVLSYDGSESDRRPATGSIPNGLYSAAALGAVHQVLPDIGRSYNYWTWVPQFGGVTLFKNLLGETCLIAAWFGLEFHDRLQEAAGPRPSLSFGPHAIIIAMAIYLFLTPIP